MVIAATECGLSHPHGVLASTNTVRCGAAEVDGVELCVSLI